MDELNTSVGLALTGFFEMEKQRLKPKAIDCELCGSLNCQDYKNDF